MLPGKREGSMRSRIQIASALVAFALASGIAGAASTRTVNPSSSDVKKMMQDAHTAQQYQALGAYFRSRQKAFEQKAHSEIEWIARRDQNVSLNAARYPAPLESARDRYEYFNYEAQQMSRQAARYESLSLSAPQ
jgi:outer membrane biogenesis lipoprotein LolB